MIKYFLKCMRFFILKLRFYPGNTCVINNRLPEVSDSVEPAAIEWEDAPFFLVGGMQPSGALDLEVEDTLRGLTDKEGICLLLSLSPLPTPPQGWYSAGTQ